MEIDSQQPYRCNDPKLSNLEKWSLELYFFRFNLNIQNSWKEIGHYALESLPTRFLSNKNLPEDRNSNERNCCYTLLGIDLSNFKNRLVNEWAFAISCAPISSILGSSETSCLDIRIESKNWSLKWHDFFIQKFVIEAIGYNKFDKSPFYQWFVLIHRSKNVTNWVILSRNCIMTLKTMTRRDSPPLYI